MEALPLRTRVNLSNQSNEDSSSETDAFMETFCQDELSEEALDTEFNSIADAEVYYYMGSQRPVGPSRANNDSQGDRDIWEEMIQNERMANIVSVLNEMRRSDVEIDDDGDVGMQMIIEDSLRENLDIISELAAQPSLPSYQPSEDRPSLQTSLAAQAPFNDFPQAISTMPPNTISEQVERSTTVAATEWDMPPTYSSDAESEWELVIQGATRSPVEDEPVIVPSFPPPTYSEGSDSDGSFELV